MQFKSKITGKIVDAPAHFADVAESLNLEPLDGPVDETCKDCAFNPEDEGDCLCDEDSAE